MVDEDRSSKCVKYIRSFALNDKVILSILALFDILSYAIPLTAGDIKKGPEPRIMTGSHDNHFPVYLLLFAHTFDHEVSNIGTAIL